MLAPLALLLSSICPFWLQQTMPIQTLASSYTPGEQLSFEVTPNGERGFLAEGATITFLDMHLSQPNTVPTVIDRHPMPFCQPLALRYFDSGTEKYLFIAGGALGVYRLTLCSNLFLSNPHLCPTDYADLLIQAPIGWGSSTFPMP